MPPPATSAAPAATTWLAGTAWPTGATISAPACSLNADGGTWTGPCSASSAAGIPCATVWPNLQGSMLNAAAAGTGIATGSTMWPNNTADGSILNAAVGPAVAAPCPGSTMWPNLTADGSTLNAAVGAGVADPCPGSLPNSTAETPNLTAAVAASASPCPTSNEPTSMAASPTPILDALAGSVWPTSVAGVAMWPPTFHGCAPLPAEVTTSHGFAPSAAGVAACPTTTLHGAPSRNDTGSASASAEALSAAQTKATPAVPPSNLASSTHAEPDPVPMTAPWRS